MSINTLFLSDVMLKERTIVHGNMDTKLIYPDIKYAQDVDIKPVLGTALFEKLQTIIGNGTITDSINADYKYLIDTYLVDALIYFTLYYLATSASYQFWNKGIVRKQGENTELPSMSEIADIANGYKNRAEYYANRMKLFLLDQSGRLSKYPEYRLPGNTVDTITPEQRNFTNPIYLGEEGDNPWCNKGGFNGQPYHD